jgi:hypothetical protein
MRPFADPPRRLRELQHDGSCSFISDPSFVCRDTQTVTLYLNEALARGIEPT